MNTLVDTLPKASLDEQLDFRDPNGRAAFCRLRVYRPPGLIPVIVLTELRENPGMSVTNAAEVAFYAAWLRAERPWPCVFVEHYPGGFYGDASAREDAERLASVRFPLDLEGAPLVPWRGSLVPWRGSPAFSSPTWSYLSRGDFLRFIGVLEEPE